MKHDAFFNDFLNEEVNLNPSRLKLLDDHVKAVTDFLSKNLDSYQRVERQGSYALGTIIKPVRDGQEYDADILLYMTYDGSKEPKGLYQRVCTIASGRAGPTGRRSTGRPGA